MKKNLSLWPIFTLVALECIAFAILLPILPVITTEYFARRINNGDYIDCTRNNKSYACTQGSKDANFYASVASSFGGLVMFFISSLMGVVSDKVGRKPFLVASQFLNLFFPISIVLFDNLHGTIGVYYIVSFLTSAYSTFSIEVACVADILRDSPSQRAKAFANLMAVAAAGYVIASTFVASIMSSPASEADTNVCIRIVSILYVIRVLWSVFFLEETLPVVNNSELLKSTSKNVAVINPITSMSILLRTSLFKKLTSLVVLVSFISNGITSILFFYLNNEFGFTSHDIAINLVIDGFSAILAQGLLVSPLLKLFSERGVIIISVFSSVLINVAWSLMIVETGDADDAKEVDRIKLYVHGLTSLNGLSSLTFPAIASLKSINVSDREQGQIQGAIYSAKAIAASVGPAVFTWLYSHEASGNKFWSISPFVLSSVMYAAALVIAITIRTPPLNDGDQYNDNSSSSAKDSLLQEIEQELNEAVI